MAWTRVVAMARRVRNVCERILVICGAFLINSMWGERRRTRGGSTASNLKTWKSRDMKKMMGRAG